MTDIHAKLQEEKRQRAIRARRRFKAAVLNVIYNYSWIRDEDYVVATDNQLKENLSRINRQKKSAEGQLTLHEIAILRKDAKYRTEAEVQLLNKYIGAFKCFRLYPEDVREQLVKVTYFEYYGPKRVLIKENHKGHALYFLLKGEVLIYKMQLDIMTNEYVQVQVNTTSAGNMFGEISLLHNIPRTATVITSAPCQLLVLKKDDFDRVLKARLMQQWKEVRESMQRFVYFDNWTDVAIQECCMLGSIESYEPNAVIYGDKKHDKVSTKMIYFVIEGVCSVVEHMFLHETIKGTTKIYKVYDLPEPEPVKVELPIKAPLNIEKMEENIEESLKKVDEGRMSHEIGLPKTSEHDQINRKSSSKLKSRFSLPKQGIEKNDSVSSEDFASKRQLPENISSEFRRSSVSLGENHATSLDVLQKELCLDEDKKDTSIIKLPPNVKVRFIQICTFRELATFFESKLMKNRRVIALTPVKVLTIPVYWLNSHNNGNFWSRIQDYLQIKLPSKQQVFKAYVKKQRWLEYKRKLRNDILSKKTFYNNTTINDVPYSIRIMSNYKN